MPGHDHSIARNMIAGDLNSHEALWLWNCPVTNELELDIWEVLMWVDSEAAAWVSGAAETVDYFG